MYIHKKKKTAQYLRNCPRLSLYQKGSSSMVGKISIFTWELWVDLKIFYFNIIFTVSLILLMESVSRGVFKWLIKTQLKLFKIATHFMSTLIFE